VGDSLRITANIREIEPQDHRYYSAHVAYRPSGGTQYTKLEMTRTGKIWKAYIQVTPALSSGFEYLVVAKPNPTELPNRSKLLSGQPQSPHRVRIHRN